MFASRLEPYVHAVVAGVRRSAVRPGAPLVVGAVAEAFVYRLSQAAQSPAPFREWLRGICRSYGDVAALRELLLGLPGAIERELHDAGVITISAGADVVAREVESVVSEHWRPLSVAPDAPLDELDARIDAFITRLEGKDPLTAEHSRAVGRWSARLARALGLDAADVTYVTRSGLLHDVGKTATPSDILNAPRALSDDEWKIMRDHTAAGEVMIVSVPELRAFAPAVRSHHERLDGKGYPDKMPGSAIPLVARIVSVADCFNAMIGRRPYRLPMPPSRAMEELLRNRGTQFDPEIVDAMIGIVLAPEHAG